MIATIAHRKLRFDVLLCHLRSLLENPTIMTPFSRRNTLGCCVRVHSVAADANLCIPPTSIIGHWAWVKLPNARSALVAAVARQVNPDDADPMLKFCGSAFLHVRVPACRCKVDIICRAVAGQGRVHRHDQTQSHDTMIYLEFEEKRFDTLEYLQGIQSFLGEPIIVLTLFGNEVQDVRESTDVCIECSCHRRKL